jgi:transposase-like protein
MLVWLTLEVYMQRKKHSDKFKARVALEAIRNHRTVNEIASEYGVHTTQVSVWKTQAMKNMQNVFSNGHDSKAKADEATKEKLYQQIGQLKVELDWLKKKTGYEL